MQISSGTTSVNSDGRAATFSGVTSHGSLLIIDRARPPWFHDPRRSRRRLTGPEYSQRGGTDESGVDEDCEFPCHDIALVARGLESRRSVRRRLWITVFHGIGRVTSCLSGGMCCTRP